MLYKKEQPYREKEVFQDLRRNDKMGDTPTT